MLVLMRVFYYTCIIWPPLFLCSFAQFLNKQRENDNSVVELIVASISLFMLLAPLYGYMFNT